MKAKCKARGLTLIEAILLVLVMSIVSLGASIGLQSVAKVPTQADLPLALNAAALDRMEQMRATPWAGLAAKATALTNTSPGILINGKYYSCTVTATAADADGGGNDADFMQITVTVGGKTL